MNARFFFYVAAEICGMFTQDRIFIASEKRRIDQSGFIRTYHVTRLVAYRQTFGRSYRLYLEETTHHGSILQRKSAPSTGSIFLGVFSREDFKFIEKIKTDLLQRIAQTLRAGVPYDEWHSKKTRRGIYQRALRRMMTVKTMMTGPL